MSISCIKCQSSNINEVVKDNHLYFFCTECNQLFERAIDTQYGKDVLINTKEGAYHVSAGGAIKNGSQYLLIKRRTYPFAYDFPGGHIEYNETPLSALQREILEETGLTLTDAKLIFCDVIKGSKCRYGVDAHMQYFYECTPGDGIPVLNPESEGIGWYSLEEIQHLNLAPGARHLLQHAILKK